MKMIDAAGLELDAEYSVEPDDGHLALILASSSGRWRGQRRRNADYGPALELLISRLQQFEAVVVSAVVDSRNTSTLPESERSLIDGPIDLIAVADVRALCGKLRNAQRPIGRKSEFTRHGNSVKRIRLRLRVPGYGSLDCYALSTDLSNAIEVAPETAIAIVDTTIGGEWEADPGLAYQRCIELVELRITSGPCVRQSVTTSKPVRYHAARRAVMIRSGGRCENPNCGEPAPDITDNGLPVLEVDHVEDIAKGGRDHPEQMMIALCPNCHAVKTRGRMRHTMYGILLDEAAQRHKTRSADPWTSA
ncbi:HNH endonuclease [Nocardia fluminea]|uniref:HNH endonuclease n=1 Tax=Nocardia fluminea TaxID=134984 RepID=A0A2N3V4A9_9NOCA|nr:HNH endonuclease signature motif containing protein [Nocardia fluminea]PKV76458.1 HNH endonuclease [Nocardia fluminea]